MVRRGLGGVCVYCGLDRAGAAVVVVVRWAGWFGWESAFLKWVSGCATIVYVLVCKGSRSLCGGKMVACRRTRECRVKRGSGS